jgi:two-component system sensor histidine kinase/response regulator
MELPDNLPIRLPGFDLAAGLDQLQGNADLYRRLLAQFHFSYNDAPDLLRQALDRGDLREALRLVHNTRGVAATLHAQELLESADTLERALSANQVPENRVKSYLENLRKILSGLDAWLNPR